MNEGKSPEQAAKQWKNCPNTQMSILLMWRNWSPMLPDINERKWARVTGHADLPFPESLQAFSLQCEDLLRVLRALPFESWEKSAIISEHKHTVFTQVRRLAKHKQEHCRQIEGLLGSTAQR